MAAFSIGELSGRTKVNVETIRYYERIGILAPPPRTQGGHRVYGEDQIKRLHFVRRSRELGFALEGVKQMLRIIDGGDVTCEQVRLIASDHLEDVRAKLADLKRMEKALSKTVNQCAGGKTPDCPIIETLFSGAP